VGRVRRVEVDQECTNLIGGAGPLNALQARVVALKRERAATNGDREREKRDERLAELVGEATEVELRERKMRVEDALQATRAAVDEGLVGAHPPGRLGRAAALQRHQRGPWPQRGSARLWRSAEDGRHRSSQGEPAGFAEFGIGCLAAVDIRLHDRPRACAAGASRFVFCDVA